jgi:hypothetical protein
MQFSASKYSEGILLMGEHHFHDGDFAFDWEGWGPQLREPRSSGHKSHRPFHAELPEPSGHL